MPSRYTPFRARLLLATALLLAPLAAHAQIEQKLTASDGSSSDYFGFSVSVSGDVAVVGADGDDDNGPSSGSAYVFRRVSGAWVEEQKLTASDGSTEDRFGFSVSVSGDATIVGAYEDDASSGSAYVFRRVGGAWVEEQKLTASSGAASDRFGRSVSVSGDVAVVGVVGDDDNGPSSGSAYMFRRVGGVWVEEQKLTASDGSSYVGFGRSISVSGNVAVVGADGDGDNGLFSGSAYVFRRVGGAWAEEQKLTASDGSTNDLFGGSVSVSGDVIVVGAYEDDDNGSDSGSAYVYDLSACAQSLVATLDDSTPAPGQTVTFTVTVTNDAPYSAPLDLWFVAAGPATRTVHLGSGTVPAGATVSRDVRLRVPGNAPAGQYALDLHIGRFPDGNCAPVAFTVEVGGAGVGGGAGFEALDDFFAAPTTASAAPAPAVLSPNPASGRGAVAFTLEAPSAVRLALYDVLGREVVAVDAGPLGAGPHRLSLDVSALPAGVYVWRLAAGERIEAGRLTVAR